MKKTTAILIFMLMLCSLSAKAFYVGTEVGIGNNSVIRGKNYKGYTYSPASGYFISVPVVYEFNVWAGIESGVTVSGKNYTLERYYRGTTIENLRTNNVFIEIPVLMRFKTPDYMGFALYAACGGYLGYWIWGQQTGESMGLSLTDPAHVNQEMDLSHRNRFDAGVLAALGCTLDFSHLRIQFGCKYILALTDMNLSQKKGGYPIHNSTFVVGGGLMWRCF